ncbi:MAG: tetratricopeptide repeat protein [bacterium]
MVDLSSQAFGENTVLDLALRLGVRTQAVLDTLNSMGLEIDDPTAPLDPQIEETVIGRMVESGQVAKRALKKAKKRRHAQDPIADDTILKEALGASQVGYSEAAIPRQVAHLVTEEKPSLLERFGLRRRSREEPEEVVETFDREAAAPPVEEPPVFEPPSPPRRAPKPPRREEPPVVEEDEELDLDLDLPDLAEVGIAEEAVDEEELDLDLEGMMEEEAPTEEAVDEEELDLDLEGMMEEEEPTEEAVDEEDPDLDLDLEQLMEEEPEAEAEPEIEVGEESVSPIEEAEDDLGEDLDLTGLDLGEDEEELGDVEEAALDDLLLGEEGDDSILEGLEDLDLGDFTGLPEEEEAPAAEPEEAVEEAEEAEEGEEGEEEAEGEAEEKEEAEKLPTLLEKIILKLDLSPAEIVAAAVGSLLIMLTALGLTVYYYLNYSPQKADDLWEQGYRAYQSEVLREERFTVIFDSFTRLLTDFPYDAHLEEAAYLLGKSFYRRAEETAETNRDAAKPLYADTVEYFQKFLAEQDRIGNRLAQQSGQSHRRYMNQEWREDAYYNIAVAYEKQSEFKQALDNYEAFLKEYPKSKRVSKVRITVGDIYRRWADVDENYRAERLMTAIQKYQEALDDPSTDRQTRIALHTGIGDINRLLYDTTKEEYRQGFIEATLREYRNAEKSLLGGDKGSIEYNSLERDLAFGLADTLLILGKNAAEDAKKEEAAAENFDRSAQLRTSQLAAAEVMRATANHYLSEASYLYSRLIGVEPAVPFTPSKQADSSGAILETSGTSILSNEQKVRVGANLAESYFYMGLYDEAIDTARPLVDDLYAKDRNNPYLASLCYLVGDAAWESGDYGSLMVDYYKKGRELKPLFPPATGERSNAAAIRMANTYYKRGIDEGNPKDLENAIDQYNLILVSFPETDWTYFTRYWLAKTYERYADVLSDPESPNYSPEKAKENYSQAQLQYELAMIARRTSKLLDKRNRDALKDCYFRPGRCAYRAGDLKKAKELLMGAIVWSTTEARGDPRSIPCRELLGDIYLELGHPDQAIRIYEWYLDQKYDQLDSRGDSLSRVSLKLAEGYLKRFSYGQAREILQRLVQNNPVVRRPGSKEVEEGPGLKAQRFLAQSYRDEADASFDEIRQDNLRAAADAYRTLLNMNPNEYSAYRDLAEINFDLAGPDQPESYQQAIDNYKQFAASGAADLEPDRDVIYYRWGDCYCHLGDYENATETLKKINGTSIPPDAHARALLLLGECYEKLSEQQTKDFDKQYYLTMAKETYLQTIDTKDRFASQVARNKITLISMRLNP